MPQVLNFFPNIIILAIFTTLIIPLFFTNQQNFPEAAKKAVKTAFFISLFSLSSLISQNQETLNEQKE